MKTYPLTPDQFSALRTKLLSTGVTLSSDGILSYQGIVLKYHYDGEALTLTIQEKPLLIPSGLIWGKVDDWVLAWAL